MSRFLRSIIEELGEVMELFFLGSIRKLCGKMFPKQQTEAQNLKILKNKRATRCDRKLILLMISIVSKYAGLEDELLQIVA